MALNPNVVVVAPNDLITSAHLNNIRANLDRIDIAASARVAKAGDTMTGDLTVPNVLLSAAQSAAPSSAARRDFVTGNFLAKAGDTATGALIIGGNPSGGPPFPQGTLLRTDGTVQSRQHTPAAPNLIALRAGTAGANGQRFADFQYGTSSTDAGVTIGSISIASTSSVAYNTTSDERLKDVIGPLDEPLERVLSLRPIRFRWKSDGTEQDGFLAHEVADVVPDAVTGERGAVTDDGAIDPQQLDMSRLIPVLVAAVQALTQRVADLEGNGGPL